MVILLYKKGRDPAFSNAYRPICLLNTLSKVFKNLVRASFLNELIGVTSSAENKFGFVKNNSAIDALFSVVRHMETQTYQWLVVASLDVKNAFNSARWDLILNELWRRELPPYLQAIWLYF